MHTQQNAMQPLQPIMQALQHGTQGHAAHRARIAQQSRPRWRHAMQSLAFAGALLGSVSVLAASSLPLAQDLRTEASQAARNKQPLIVLYSLPGCPHCEVVRRSHLLPLLAEKPPRVRVVQIDLRSAAPLTDFAGRKTTHGEYSQQQKIVLAPVVVFLDGQGNALTEPLVGSMIPDFYGAYFDEALDTAMRRIRAVTSSAADSSAAPAAAR